MPRTTKLLTKKVTEVVDMDVLHYIKTHVNDDDMYMKNWIHDIEHQRMGVIEDLAKLETVIAKFETLYVKSHKDLGWKYRNPGTVGLQNIYRPLRNAITKRLVQDIDMVNACPSIAEQVCDRRGLACPNLKAYNSNREELLQEVIKACNVHRDSAKRLFIMILYGGSVSQWSNTCDVNEDNIPDFPLRLQEEATSIRKRLWENAPKEHRKWILKQRDELSADRSYMSYYLQNIVDKCITVVFDTLQKRNIKCYTLMSDGFYLDKSYNMTDLELKKLESLVKKVTGYQITLKCKAMEDCLIIPKNLETHTSILDNDTLFNLDNLMDTLYDYDTVKQYVERFFVEIMYPHCFLSLHQDCFGGLIWIQQTPDAIKSIFRKKVKFTTGSDKIPFLNAWLQGKNRLYNTFQYVPFNTETPDIRDDCFNVFNGYNKNVVNQPLLEEAIRAKLLVDTMKVVTTLCGNDEKVIDFVLDVLALKIQVPSFKIDVILSFVGPMGTGKSLFMKLLEYIIGPTNFYQTANSGDLFGKHATGFENKIICNLNEVNNIKKVGSLIKQATTEDRWTINRKNVSQYDIKNYALNIFTLNNSAELPIDAKAGGAERIVPILGTDELRTGFDWVKYADSIVSLEAPIAFYQFLMARDVKNKQISRRTAPITKLMKDLRSSNKPIIVEWIEFVMKAKEDFANTQQDGWWFISNDMVVESYKKFKSRTRGGLYIERRDACLKTIKKYLTELNCNPFKEKQKTINEKRCRGYLFHEKEIKALVEFYQAEEAESLDEHAMESKTNSNMEEIERLKKELHEMRVQYMKSQAENQKMKEKEKQKLNSAIGKAFEPRDDEVVMIGNLKIGMINV